MSIPEFPHIPQKLESLRQDWNNLPSDVKDAKTPRIFFGIKDNNFTVVANKPDKRLLKDAFNFEEKLEALKSALEELNKEDLTEEEIKTEKELAKIYDRLVKLLVQKKYTHNWFMRLFRKDHSQEKEQQFYLILRLHKSTRSNLPEGSSVEPQQTNLPQGGTSQAQNVEIRPEGKVPLSPESQSQTLRPQRPPQAVIKEVELIQPERVSEVGRRPSSPEPEFQTEGTEQPRVLEGLAPKLLEGKKNKLGQQLSTIKGEVSGFEKQAVVEKWEKSLKGVENLADFETLEKEVQEKERKFEEIDRELEGEKERAATKLQQEIDTSSHEEIEKLTSLATLSNALQLESVAIATSQQTIEKAPNVKSRIAELREGKAPIQAQIENETRAVHQEFQETLQKAREAEAKQEQEILKALAARCEVLENRKEVVRQLYEAVDQELGEIALPVASKNIEHASACLGEIERKEAELQQKEKEICNELRERVTNYCNEVEGVAQNVCKGETLKSVEEYTESIEDLQTIFAAWEKIAEDEKSPPRNTLSELVDPLKRAEEWLEAIKAEQDAQNKRDELKTSAPPTKEEQQLLAAWEKEIPLQKAPGLSERIKDFENKMRAVDEQFLKATPADTPDTLSASAGEKQLKVAQAADSYRLLKADMERILKEKLSQLNKQLTTQRALAERLVKEGLVESAPALPRLTRTPTVDAVKAAAEQVQQYKSQVQRGLQMACETSRSKIEGLQQENLTNETILQVAQKQKELQNEVNNKLASLSRLSNAFQQASIDVENEKKSLQQLEESFNSIDEKVIAFARQETSRQLSEGISKAMAPIQKNITVLAPLYERMSVPFPSHSENVRKLQEKFLEKVKQASFSPGVDVKEQIADFVSQEMTLFKNELDSESSQVKVSEESILITILNKSEALKSKLNKLKELEQAFQVSAEKAPLDEIVIDNAPDQIGAVASYINDLETWERELKEQEETWSRGLLESSNGFRDYTIQLAKGRLTEENLESVDSSISDCQGVCKQFQQFFTLVAPLVESEDLPLVNKALVEVNSSTRQASHWVGALNSIVVAFKAHGQFTRRPLPTEDELQGLESLGGKQLRSMVAKGNETREQLRTLFNSRNVPDSPEGLSDEASNLEEQVKRASQEQDAIDNAVHSVLEKKREEIAEQQRVCSIFHKSLIKEKILPGTDQFSIHVMQLTNQCNTAFTIDGSKTGEYLQVLRARESAIPEEQHILKGYFLSAVKAAEQVARNAENYEERRQAVLLLNQCEKVCREATTLIAGVAFIQDQVPQVLSKLETMKDMLVVAERRTLIDSISAMIDQVVAKKVEELSKMNAITRELNPASSIPSQQKKEAQYESYLSQKMKEVGERIKQELQTLNPFERPQEKRDFNNEFAKKLNSALATPDADKVALTQCIQTARENASNALERERGGILQLSETLQGFVRDHHYTLPEDLEKLMGEVKGIAKSSNSTEIIHLYEKLCLLRNGMRDFVQQHLLSTVSSIGPNLEDVEVQVLHHHISERIKDEKLSLKDMIDLLPDAERVKQWAAEQANPQLLLERANTAWSHIKEQLQNEVGRDSFLGKLLVEGDRVQAVCLENSSDINRIRFFMNLTKGITGLLKQENENITQKTLAALNETYALFSMLHTDTGELSSWMQERFSIEPLIRFFPIFEEGVPLSSFFAFMGASGSMERAVQTLTSMRDLLVGFSGYSAQLARKDAILEETVVKTKMPLKYRELFIRQASELDVQFAKIAKDIFDSAHPQKALDQCFVNFQFCKSFCDQYRALVDQLEQMKELITNVLLVEEFASTLPRESILKELLGKALEGVRNLIVEQSKKGSINISSLIQEFKKMSDIIVTAMKSLRNSLDTFSPLQQGEGAKLLIRYQFEIPFREEYKYRVSEQYPVETRSAIIKLYQAREREIQDTLGENPTFEARIAAHERYFLPPTTEELQRFRIDSQKPPQRKRK